MKKSLIAAAAAAMLICSQATGENIKNYNDCVKSVNDAFPKAEITDLAVIEGPSYICLFVQENVIELTISVDQGTKVWVIDKTEDNIIASYNLFAILCTTYSFQTADYLRDGKFITNGSYSTWEQFFAGIEEEFNV